MTQRMWTMAIFAAGAGMLVCGHAWAQGFGGGTSPSGSNLTSGVGFGNASYSNSSGMGTTGSFGSGTMGTGSFGSGSFGSSGFGQGTGQSGFGTTTSGFGSQQQSSFIGRDSADVTSMFESMTRQATQGMNRGQGGGTNNRGRDANSGNSTQQQIRVQLKVAFDVPDAATSPMATELTSRLAKVLEERKVSDFDFTVDNGNVVLTGVAADDFERLLIQQLISQQPGVANVTNQMTVAEAIAAPTPQE